jgi:hypothetical protein
LTEELRKGSRDILIIRMMLGNSPLRLKGILEYLEEMIRRTSIDLKEGLESGRAVGRRILLRRKLLLTLLEMAVWDRDVLLGVGWDWSFLGF